MSFLTARDGTKLFEYRWAASGQRRGGVLLMHGYGEHLGRYEHVARPIAEAGFEVAGCDFRGHGKSSGVRGFCRTFTEYFDDLETARARLDPGAPLYGLAHSFGALVALRYCMEHAARPGLTGLVLSSPYLKLKFEGSPIKKAAGRLVSGLWPSFNQPMGIKGSDVTRDPDQQRAYEADPLNNKNATARWFTESLEAQERALERAAEVTLPCLMLQAGEDGVADPDRSEEVFRRLGSVDKTFERLPGQRHEILNELPADRERTIAKVVGWLKAHAASAVA
jgi:alpha-beta hydrolase superfamily lysophospholipase